MQIRFAEEKDLPALWAHMERHTLETLDPEDPISSPVIAPIDPEGFEDWKKSLLKRWALTPQQVGWRRTWILCDEEKVWGDFVLENRVPLESALHHCLLMMGMERGARGKGWGRKLIEAGIRWALEQKTIEAIQLNVFDTNPRALRLYESFGFRESGRVEDMFRVRGQNVTDITMVLSIR
jgi:RimJ/RimL family protein N-acetyltransferase